MATPTIQFTKIEDTSAIINVLMDRLPKSANIYNMALFHSKFQKEMKFYFLQTQITKDKSDSGQRSSKIGDDTWIIVIYTRPDVGQEISISVPKDPFRRITPTQIQNGFLSTNIVNWNSPYLFSAVDISISQIFFECSCRIHGHITSVYPCNFYYMDIDDVEATQVDTLLQSIRSKKETKTTEVKSLRSISGIEFFVKNWEYTMPGTGSYVGEVLKHIPSSGVFVDGEIVSGILLNASGLMGMLSTLSEFRRKGLGKLAMQSLIITLGNSGYVPCSTVMKSNEESNVFHKKLGLKISHSVEMILYLPK